jgi:hypothetical protein
MKALKNAVSLSEKCDANCNLERIPLDQGFLI